MKASTRPEPLPIVVNGVELLADISGALVWPARRLVMLADLHLEKGSAYAAGGRLLPPYDTAQTLARLARVLGRYRAETVACLGDSFHDPEAGERVSGADGAAIRALTGRHDWTWITGNHDPAPPRTWGGRTAGELTLGALVLRHEALAEGRAAGEISGHYHPKAAVRVRGKRVTARCFVGDGRRLILPAFGAYAGGLNVLDPAISGLFGGGFATWLLGRGRIFAFPQQGLVS